MTREKGRRRRKPRRSFLKQQIIFPIYESQEGGARSPTIRGPIMPECIKTQKSVAALLPASLPSTFNRISPWRARRTIEPCSPARGGGEQKKTRVYMHNSGIHAELARGKKNTYPRWTSGMEMHS